jgi:hypothetical protein
VVPRDRRDLTRRITVVLAAWTKKYRTPYLKITEARRAGGMV